MAVVLRLTDGTDTIDFVSAGSDYKLVQGGLTLSLPEVKRLMGGDPLLTDGQQLVERRYGNREITVVFNVEAADHDALVADLRAINRLLDTAKKVAKEGFGSLVELQYKLDDASDTVVFDALDGELNIDNISAPTTRRDATLLKAELTLICRPFARLTAPIEVDNWLKNPAWSHNVGVPDKPWMADLDGSTQWLERASSTGMAPSAKMSMALGLWLQWGAQASATTTLVLCGNTTEAYKLYIDSDNKVRFRWQDGSAHELIAADALTAGPYVFHFIGVAAVAISASQSVVVLIIDDQIVAADKFTGLNHVTSPAGEFTVGAKADSTEEFDGRMGGLVITKDRQITPHQVFYMLRYGLGGLTEADNVTAPQYWGLEAADFVGAWPHFEAGAVCDDESGNNRDLTYINSPTHGAAGGQPSGWTIGPAMYVDPNVRLVTTQIKHGIYSYQIKNTASVNCYLSQSVVNMPADGWSVVIWLYGQGDTRQIEIEFDGVTKTITAPLGEWSQWLLTKTITAGTKTFKIKWVTSGDTDILIGPVMLTKGTPFGASAADYTNVTNRTIKVPFVGCRFLRAWPDVDEVSFVDFNFMPGDAPAGVRLFVQNKSGATLLPVRVGMQMGHNPWKQVLQWRAAEWVPYGSDTDYASGANPDITTACAANLLDRLAASLPRLFPFPSDQRGSFKFFVDVEPEPGMVSAGRISTTAMSILLSGDPAREPAGIPAGTGHLLDAGILSWPPTQALSEHRAGRVTSRGRKTQHSDLLAPTLAVANIAEAAIAAPNVAYRHLLLLPMDGYASLVYGMYEQGEANALLDDEVLVIDTIEENTLGRIYLANELTLPDSATAQRLAQLGGAALSTYGTGLYIEPNLPGQIMVVPCEIGVASWDIGVGDFKEGTATEAWLEYSPRFLFV